MANVFSNIWDWLIGLFGKVRKSRLWSVILGLTTAAFFFIVCGMTFCAWPVLFVAFLKELIGVIADRGFDVWDFAATIAGGLIIQLFVIL